MPAPRDVRVGDTIRRIPGERYEYVTALLGHLGRVGWPGAPRHLGLDAQGREVLSVVEGHVAAAPAQPPDVWSRASLGRVAQLARQLHDLTAGTHLAADEEVACHNALAPGVTVYRDAGEGLRPIAFVGWDHAAPGRRIHDVAALCWRFLDLGPRRRSPVSAARLMRLVCDAYGLADRHQLVETVRWYQVRAWGRIEDGAVLGDPAMAELRDSGAVEEIKASYDWVTRHRDVLEHVLNG